MYACLHTFRPRISFLRILSGFCPPSSRLKGAMRFWPSFRRFRFFSWALGTFPPQVISSQTVRTTGFLFSEQICDRLLSSVKSWGRDAWGLIAEIDLGTISPDALPAFVRISKQCFASDPTRFAEAISILCFLFYKTKSPCRQPCSQPRTQSTSPS